MSVVKVPVSDPDVKIPAAVRASSARAQAAFESQPGKEPKPEEQDPPADNEEQDQSEQKSEQKPDDQAPPPVTPPGNQQPENWEHRYQSMKGRYDKDVRSLSEQVAGLQRVISTLQAAPPKAPASAPAELRAEDLISDKEKEEYGEEFLGVVGKKARSEVASLVSNLKGEIDSLKQQLGSVGASVVADARAKMQKDLNDNIPNWQEINTNEDFLRWLQLPDPYSGAIRQNLLNAAYERNDSPRVLAFFKGFLAEEAALAPAEPGVTTELAAPAPSNKVPLANLAAPGRAKSAANTPPAEKPLISRAQVTAFYAEVAAGKYRGKPQEKDRLEKMIFDAQSDGRITG